jgi:hypothetical protein
MLCDVDVEGEEEFVLCAKCLAEEVAAEAASERRFI